MSDYSRHSKLEQNAERFGTYVFDEITRIQELISSEASSINFADELQPYFKYVVRRSYKLDKGYDSLDENVQRKALLTSALRIQKTA